MIGMWLLVSASGCFCALLARQVVIEWRAYQHRREVAEVLAEFGDAIPAITRAFSDFGISTRQAAQAVWRMAQALDEVPA